MMWQHALAIVASYLIGSMPTSYIVCKLVRGIDLREYGSKNLGATNLYRVLGWKYAIPVAILDAAKGTVATVVFGAMASDSQLFHLACGGAAVLGHVFSMWVGFKGGKGVATAAGVVLGLAPLALLVSFAVWVGLVYFTGYVSLGSVVGAALFPVMDWLLYPAHRATIWVDVLLVSIIIWMHRANIHRLMNGNENRFGRHERPAPPVA